MCRPHSRDELLIMCLKSVSMQKHYTHADIHIHTFCVGVPHKELLRVYAF
jgi:hypothetical protein